MEETKLNEETLRDRIEQLLSENRYADIRALLLDMNYVDIEGLLADFPPEEMLRIFRMLTKEIAAEVFTEMDSDMQQYIIESITDTEVIRILDELYMDDTVDFIEEMPANVVKRVLRNTDEATRKTINQLLQYPDDSAGSIMTTEFVDLKKEMTVAEALEHIRKTGVDKETINTCYVISPQRMLEGVVSIRKLILSAPDCKMSELMDTNLKFLRTLDDQETSAYLFRKYDLLSMPVVDQENRLVGIITIDDIVDVIEQENTEDVHKMAAMTPSEKPYLKTTVFETFKQRIPWLLLLMVSATFTGKIISSFEETLASCVALTAFIPMLMDTGGNSGGQSSVTIIRSLSLNDIAMRDIFKILRKEFLVSFFCGITLAAANFIKMMIVDRGTILASGQNPVLVAAVVCLTLLATVICAKLIGCSLPILAKRVGFDPAVMASPFITTIVDAISLMIYFRFATAILGVI